MKKLTKFIIQNLLIILFVPILVPFFIYVKNFTATPIGIFVRDALLSITLFIILLAFSSMILRNANRAVFFSSITFILLYLYGTFYDVLITNNSILAHHKVLGAVYLLLLIVFIFVISKLKISANLLLAVKLISCAFLLIQLAQFIPEVIRFNSQNDQNSKESMVNNSQPAVQTPMKAADANSPDVYYIILDMYARNDMIAKDFAFDNSAFTDELRSLGFFVADCSRTNYMRTTSSLASSLNMSYLQNMVDLEKKPEENDAALIAAIKNSTVFRQFEALGYKTVSFATGYGFSEITNADDFLQPAKPVSFLDSINPYEMLLFKSSILRIVYDTHITVVNNFFDQITFPYTNHVKRQFFMFDQLKEIANDPQPTFTFAHFIIPHTPFIFRADGSYTKDRSYFRGANAYPVNNDLFIDGYINQVEFVNEKIIDTVKTILANSNTPPIIILQGDHGAIMERRLPILNAYYFPDGENAGVYSTITPVNTFRLVFSRYFGLDYPLLGDDSYYSLYETSYKWALTPESEPGCMK